MVSNTIEPEACHCAILYVTTILKKSLKIQWSCIYDLNRTTVKGVLVRRPILVLFFVRRVASIMYTKCQVSISQECVHFP